MPARFFCKTGAFAGSSFEIGEEATIGRRSEAAVTLASDVISGRHARIFRDGEHYLLEDLGSSNGTRLDGVEVRTPVRLGDLHVVTLADQIDFIFQTLSTEWTPAERLAPQTELHTTADGAFAPLPGTVPEAEEEHTRFAEAFTPVPDLSDDPVVHDEAPAAPADEEERTYFGAAFTPMPDLAADDPPTVDLSDTETPPDERLTVDPPEAPVSEASEGEDDATVFRPALVPEAATAEETEFVLEVQRVGGEPERIVLSAGEQVVGRASECEITLDNPSVSRRHAVLIVRDGAVTVRDLGSKNRTRLNGEEVAGEAVVPPGAVLRFGLQVEAVVARV